MVPWDEETRAGSYVDIKGARIYGTHWYGTSANAAMPMLAESLRAARGEGLFHILLLHTDVEGQLNRPIPALSVEKLKELRSLVDYVARPFQRLTFDVSGAEDPEAVHAGVMEAVGREARSHDPESGEPAPIIE